MHLFYKHLEGLGNPRFGYVLALDDRFVRFDTTDNVIAFHCQYLLQRVCRAVCFECPNFHLAESLSAKLRFAAKRLLRNERVWSCASCVNLVVDQVMKLQYVHVADRNAIFKCFAASSVVQHCLSVRVKPQLLEIVNDVVFRRAVENGRCDFPAQCFCSKPKMYLEHLPDVHT